MGIPLTLATFFVGGTCGGTVGFRAGAGLGADYHAPYYVGAFEGAVSSVLAEMRLIVAMASHDLFVLALLSLLCNPPTPRVESCFIAVATIPKLGWRGPKLHLTPRGLTAVSRGCQRVRVRICITAQPQSHRTQP